MSKENEMEDSIAEDLRDHLLNTNRVTTKKDMYAVILHGQPKGKKMTIEQFDTMWDVMVKEGYLTKSGHGYRWNHECVFDVN